VFPTELASPHPALDFWPLANRLLWRAFELVKRPFERRSETRLAALGGTRPRGDLMGARGAEVAATVLEERWLANPSRAALPGSRRGSPQSGDLSGR